MLKLVIVTFFIICLNCNHVQKEHSQIESKKTSGKITCDSVGVFTENDSTGSVIGTVVNAQDSGNGFSGVSITLMDKNKVERRYETDYVNVPNLDMKKVIAGACVKVSYYSEIHKEEGEIVGRDYFISKIEY